MNKSIDLVAFRKDLHMFRRISDSIFVSVFERIPEMVHLVDAFIYRMADLLRSRSSSSLRSRTIVQIQMKWRWQRRETKNLAMERSVDEIAFHGSLSLTRIIIFSLRLCHCVFLCEISGLLQLLK
jgi:hypothetical protein